MDEAKETTTEYRCAECGAEVTFYDGLIIRDCKHDRFPVTANLKAVVHAAGGLVEG